MEKKRADLSAVGLAGHLVADWAGSLAACLVDEKVATKADALVGS